LLILGREDAMPYGPPANTLLFENDHTRVWEMVVQPDESFPMHSHEYPYLSLNMEAAVTLVLVEEDGTERRLELEAGAVVWGDVPDVHAVRNVGTTTFRNRLVEFKGV
jgi:quercetin dioxygenase-like cupin family protein